MASEDLGPVGAVAFLPLMAYDLATREPGTFVVMLLIAVAVVSVELLYFERDRLEEAVVATGEDVAGEPSRT
ncbi:hypothetical protein BRC89_02400 [Halobacteriales archaeon QS_4_70_19]|nr:MAG: hypothetical protein BRC89_02400 [Halobacteriales archaeon QS_4_70_19]